MRVKAYAHSSKETMYDIGQENGLKGEALRMFMYALSEVAFDLEVDPETGDAVIVKVDGKRLEKN